MTVFGRDTIITCLQTLMFGPELARSALEVLAELQATEDNPAIDAEPGKIVHEVRRGKAAKHWFETYYGTIDATPLYLILLSEVWRWTDDAALVRQFREPAMRALAWIDQYGDVDGDGFIGTGAQRDRARQPVVEGLVGLTAVQRWPDCGVADRAVEAQGYVYDAKPAWRSWRERSGADREPAERLDQRPRSCGPGSTRPLERGPWWLLRARARRPEAAGRLALLEHRAPVVDRNRHARPGRPGRRCVDGARPVVGLGSAHHVHR